MEYPFGSQTNGFLIHGAKACYFKYSTKSNSVGAKLLKQQLFDSSWRYVVQVALGWNSVSCDFLVIPISNKYL